MENSPSNQIVPVPTAQEVSRRDRIGLRAMVQDSVHHFTMLRREEAYRSFESEHNRPPTAEELDQIQPLMEEFDPVVELAIMGADRRNEPTLRRQALSDAAQYLRPKLSAVAMLDDPETIKANAQRQELAKRLAAIMDVMVGARRDAASSD